MIEETILSHLLVNEDYGRKVLPFLVEDYFHDPVDKTLFYLIKKHVDKFNAFPSKEALFIDLSNVKGINETLFNSTKVKLQNLDADSDTNIDWLLENTELFCQDKAIYNGLMQAIKIVDSKGQNENLSVGSIPKILQDALAVSFDTNIGHDYLEDWEKRYEMYHRVENKVPFDLEYFNKITRGGFSKKTLNVFLGGTHVGKSLIMCHCAAANLVQGKNVLYITMEMSEEETSKRIDANLLDISIADVESIPKDVFKKLVQKINTPGKLIVKEFPTASAGTNHFRFLLNELRLKKNFIPDIVYVDYINICTSSRLKPGVVGSYAYIKAISEELRGLAGEFNVPVVSATQMNRAGFADSDADLTHTSESFGLPMTADFMMAVITSEELQSLNQYMFKQLKNRYHDMSLHRRFVVGVDKMKMRLYDIDETAQNLVPEDDDPIMDMNYGTKPVASMFDMSKLEGFK